MEKDKIYKIFYVSQLSETKFYISLDTQYKEMFKCVRDKTIACGFDYEMAIRFIKKYQKYFSESLCLEEA